MNIYQKALIKIKVELGMSESDPEELKKELIEYIDAILDKNIFFKSCCANKPEVTKNGVLYCCRCYRQEMNNG